MSPHNNDNLEIYQLIASEAIMGILAVNESSLEIIYFNRLADHLLEPPMSKSLDQMKISDFFPEPAVSQGEHRLHLLDKQILEMEGLFQDVVVKKSTGQNFIASVGVKKATLNSSPVLLLMFQDTTIQKKLQRDLLAKQQEIKSAYEELLTQNKQLLELDVAKNRFIALTTHELRTPMSAIVATAEVLHMKFYDTQEEQDEFVEMIYQQGQHMLELINDILDFAKIQAGRMDFFVSEQDIAQLVAGQVETLEGMAEHSKITLHFEAPKAPVACYYDDVRIKQVLSNIINNAIKYNNEGGSVNIWIDENEEKVTVYVKDTGKGIPKDQQAKVFNEFETLGKVALHSKGTGLGMPISKRLIEGMGGTISLESEPGVGSTFWIEVPKTKVLAEDCYRDRPDINGDLAA
ncbi:MAG: HAMP domain-containing histidine kinase [Pseudobdellovibrionaceae bacterium]|nr:MAG: HAMP domain-containing histidine kinase [Pseudobdellovibrionaceae bacterium]